jgi:hypothetical protein
LSVAASAMAAVGGCYKVVNIEQNDFIVMDRDVALADVRGNGTHSLARMPDGGFVVAGDGWAAATSASGEVLWRYADPDWNATKPSYRTELDGAVPLSNGNLLLCGAQQTDKGSAGLLTILDGSGQLANKQLLQPTLPGSFFAARFIGCLRWNDGVAVLGIVITNDHGSGWLMKLDGGGTKQWEIIDPSLKATNAVETANHNLVIAGSSVVTTQSTNLVQVSADGKIVSTKSLASYPDQMVRSRVPTSELKVMTNVGRANAAVITLNDRFEEIAPPKPNSITLTARGCAWTLPDGSIAVFSNIFAPGGVYRSAAELIHPGNGSTEARAFPLPTPGSISASAYDAVPISDRTFVAVRDLNGVAVLSWVTFK